MIKDIKLYQNYPNPFNPTTNIKFYNNKQAVVFLNVYNIKGELVKELIKNKNYDSGYHSVSLDGSNLTQVRQYLIISKF